MKKVPLNALEGAEGRLKGLGGVSYNKLCRRDLFYFAFRRFERDATATAAKTIRPTKISRT